MPSINANTFTVDKRQKTHHPFIDWDAFTYIKSQPSPPEGVVSDIEEFSPLSSLDREEGLVTEDCDVSTAPAHLLSYQVEI